MKLLAGLSLVVVIFFLTSRKISAEPSLCIVKDNKLTYHSNPAQSSAPAQCQAACKNLGNRFYGVKRHSGGPNAACYCGDIISDFCLNECGNKCGPAASVTCGATCNSCSNPKICASVYKVEDTNSAYPKCSALSNSWIEVGQYSPAQAKQKCQETCRLLQNATGTFSAIRKNGQNGKVVFCRCGQELISSSATCAFSCGGETCGGVSSHFSIYPACLDGTYGSNCEKDCSTNCEENICGVGDGRCIAGCLTGHHGPMCTYNCSENCVDKKCDQFTSICEKCAQGIYGENCTDSCSTCNNGCEQLTGRCESGGCIEGFYGEFCRQNCSQGCLNRKCEQSDGQCTDGCIDGFYSPQCDKNCSENCVNRKCDRTSGKCDSCDKGEYGFYCNNTCPNCANDCRQDDGVCNGACEDGHFSPTCEDDCSQTCLGKKCDQITAKCDSCEKEYFGDNCTQSCSRCFDGCNQTDGVCIGGCDPGYYTSTCLKNCSATCANVLCNINSGYCDGGCITGWYTPTCNTRCPQNCDGKCDLDVGNCTVGCSNDAFFGSWCSNNCSNSCNERKCDRESGICLACVPGFYNQTCTTPCPVNCKDRDCFRDNGTCIHGCKGDWKGDDCAVEVSNPGLGTGAIVGICVAVIIVVVGIIIGVIFILRKRRIKQNKAKSMVSSTGHVNMAMTMPEEFSDDIFKRDNIEPKTLEDQMLTNNTDTNAKIYENPNDGKLTADEFLKYIRVKKHTKDYFKDEYATLPKDTLYDWESANRKFGVKKNRYRDIYPYDYNRVVMEILNNDPLTDYINASRIQGYYDHDKFIASAGPQVWTVDDFWRMVWQEKVATVVMLTNLKESLAEKCVQYWPKDTPNVTYDDITVSIASEEAFPTYAVRQLRIQKGDHKRQVCQLHFTVWPDHGVPQDPTALLNFRRKVVKKMIKNVPMVIHCSAGVGRTGTFIAMDYLMKQMAAEGAVNVFECVSNLRHQRKHFVQTDEQYKFIHEALAQHISLGDTTIVKSNRQMLENVLRMTDHKMQNEYKILQELALTMKPYDKENALSEENRGKNRDENIIPCLSSCMFLTSRVPGRNAYINAVQVHSFLRKGTFLVTQLPLAETIVDFWRLITDCNSNCIVILYTKEQAKTVPYFLPAKNKPMNVLEEMASVRSSQTNEFFRTVDICVNGQPIQENEYMNMEEIDHGTNGKRLRVFEIMLTPAQETLDPKVVLDVFSGIQQWRKEAGEQPITVTCLNGATYSGQFVASCNLFEMINTDHEVDVFQVAKYVRDSRPQFINSLNQYKGLYETANMVIAQFSIYSNV